MQEEKKITIASNDLLPCLASPSQGTGSVTDLPEIQDEEASADLDENAHLLTQHLSNNTLHRYAKTAALCRYIPELDPEHPRAKTLRVNMAKRTTMLRLQLSIAILTTITNVVVLLWSLRAHPPNSQGVGTFFFGDCSKASSLNSILHVVLNVLSSLFLGAGNYCMQILVAPSREEVDKAHTKGTSLEIGVPSAKNLRHIHASRVTVWSFICFITILLHLFWNSAIFTSLPVDTIPRAIVTSDFMTATDNWTATDPLSHSPWWQPPPSAHRDRRLNISLVYSLQTRSANFGRLDTTACIKQFIDPLSATGALVVVTRDMTSKQNNGSSLIVGYVSTWDLWPESAGWICDAYQSDDMDQWKICSQQWANTFADQWQLAISANTLSVDYCLAENQRRSAGRCGFHYSAHILIVVCLCTIVESCLVFWTWFHHRRNLRTEEEKRDRITLVTMGDAIHSFLKNPDLINSENGGEKNSTSIAKSQLVRLREAPWLATSRTRWFHAITGSIWAVSMMFFTMGIVIPLYLLISTIQWQRRSGIDTSLAEIWRRGFKVQPSTVAYRLPSLHRTDHDTVIVILANIFIANSPQLMLNFLYLLYNNILTRQLVADEWVRFLQKDGKKPLRMSSPIGMQRSSYFLSLPLKYTIPLMAFSVILHWLISQSIFVVKTCTFAPGPNGIYLPDLDFTARGFSTLGTGLAIVLGSALLTALILHSVLRQYRDIPPGFQLMGFNSSGIRALCQPPEGDSDGYLFPIMIVAVPARSTGHRTDNPRRLAFSTDIEAEPPKLGETYVQPVFAGGQRRRWKFTTTAKVFIKTAYDLVSRRR